MISDRERAANRRYYLRSKPARRLRLLLKSGQLTQEQRVEATRALEVEVAKLRATSPRPRKLAAAERAAADREKAKRWHDKNKHRAREKVARRKAGLRSLACKCCTHEERAQWYQIARQQGLTVDHIVPMAMGGMHCCRNFQFLSKAENSSKGARWDARCDRIAAYNTQQIRRLKDKVGVALSRMQRGQPHSLPKMPRTLKVMPLPATARPPAP